MHCCCPVGHGCNAPDAPDPAGNVGSASQALTITGASSGTGATEPTGAAGPTGTAGSIGGMGQTGATSMGSTGQARTTGLPGAEPSLMVWLSAIRFRTVRGKRVQLPFVLSGPAKVTLTVLRGKSGGRHAWRHAPQGRSRPAHVERQDQADVCPQRCLQDHRDSRFLGRRLGPRNGDAAHHLTDPAGILRARMSAERPSLATLVSKVVPCADDLSAPPARFAPFPAPPRPAVNIPPAWERREELAMPSDTAGNARPASVTSSKPAEWRVAGAAPVSPATKGAATLRRHREEQRADKLAQIRAQIADGTLVVRQMTVAQHDEASRADRRTLAENQERRKRNTAARNHNPITGSPVRIVEGAVNRKKLSATNRRR
jgi:anti-sigma28 factor (negative regulator of flagellin synthesis)